MRIPFGFFEWGIEVLTELIPNALQEIAGGFCQFFTLVEA
jgi:hypothetical protein